MTLRRLLLTALLAAPALARAEGEAPASAEASSEAPSGLRKRYDPGLAVHALVDVRSWEGLVASQASAPAASTALGVGLGYSWDLVSLRAEFLQSLVLAGEHKPTFLKARGDYAFFTLAGFSLLGNLGLDVALNAPSYQSAKDGGSMLGPELGLAARYRIFPKLDAYVAGSAALLQATSGPSRMFFDPGLFAGIAIHPLGQED